MGFNISGIVTTTLQELSQNNMARAFSALLRGYEFFLGLRPPWYSIALSALKSN